MTNIYASFEELPEIYDTLPAYVNRRDVRFYVDEALNAGGRVLEVGCGTGRILLPIARAGIRIDGLDGSREMLDRCRANLGAEDAAVRDRVRLHEGDARTFDLKERFSLVIAPFRVVQHLTTTDDQLRFLDSVARHLGPEGRLVFDVFNPDFGALVSADGVERDDTPETPLPDGRSFRRAVRISRVRLIEQVSEVELVYYISAGAGKKAARHVHAFDMRWFLRAELTHLLARGGFTIRTMYGDFDRSPLTDKSPEQIVCAERVTVGAP